MRLLVALLRLIPLIPLAVASPALADTTATFTHAPTGSRMVLEIDDNEDWRGAYQPGTDPGFYYLTRNATPYLVNVESGTREAQRLHDVFRLWGRIGERMGTPMASRSEVADHEDNYQFVHVGSGSVLGRETTIWRLCSTAMLCDGGFEIELSDDPEFALLGQTLRFAYSYEFSFFMGIFGPAPPGNLRQLLTAGALVRFDTLELTDIDHDQIEPARLELPPLQSFDEMLKEADEALAAKAP